MLRNRAYYAVKPWLPDRIRIALRRLHARRVHRLSAGSWPILESAGRRPDGWPGWPNGAKFAFVLTHDVESQRGLNRVRDVAKIDQSFGFRSSFNLVPEGTYNVPRELREWLTREGFEVGVHDHRHDGKLFSSRRQFQEGARRINHFLKAWGACGFRSGFMLRNLDWIHGLELAYDSSTFDTDPFEPQPSGVGTIFPFWVANGRGGRGYVELPYTLPQDSTLFLLLRMTDIRIWQQKIDWVAKHGGMVLVDVHPDYIAPDKARPGHDEYPSAYYTKLLQHLREQYDGQFWHALPREMAAYCSELTAKRSSKPAGFTPVSSSGFPASPRNSGPSAKPELAVRRGTIWIDLDNTPHVPFFKPIVRELEGAGYQILLTARDAFQVCDLAERMKMPCRRVGRHYGRNPFLKVYGITARALQLLPLVLRDRPLIGLSHGSRAQILLCNLLRIPSVLILDYEHAKPFPFSRPKWEIVPESLPDSGLLCSRNRGRRYPGIKEDVYAPDFRPDASLLEELGLNQRDLVVTVRPPADEAHYHNPESELLFSELMTRVTALPETRIVLLPRNDRQAQTIRGLNPGWFENGKTIIPEHAIDGLNLLWHSDLVVSGGGTMNREAAALGVPVYSIFRGKLGAVDRKLEEEGRLTMIASVDEVRDRIRFERRDKTWKEHFQKCSALTRIMDHLEEILDVEYSRSPVDRESRPGTVPLPGAQPL